MWHRFVRLSTKQRPFKASRRSLSGIVLWARVRLRTTEAATNATARRMVHRLGAMLSAIPSRTSAAIPTSPSPSSQKLRPSTKLDSRNWKALQQPVMLRKRLGQSRMQRKLLSSKIGLQANCPRLTGRASSRSRTMQLAALQALASCFSPNKCPT